ncbi:MAG: molecular chaperone HtpG [Eubacteriales bacterium]|nr:molecular chaperone HtpG [Eubacteriales bacterium]
MAKIKKGNLNINSENIFPIIKKWLYQDHDIFYRELISNGCDAVTKLKKLALIGEYTASEDEKYRVDVVVDPESNTITFTDNGIGMTDEEVQKYINEIAFSGAADFLEKYKDKANDDQIIGHFGLGFYSAFMVSDKVTIDTLSYKQDAEPVFWVSEGGMQFEMKEGSRKTHGTTITLYINDEELQFCNEYKAREVIDKYCSFMPVEIYLKDAARERREAAEAEKKAAEAKPAEVNEDGTVNALNVEEIKEEKPVNDTNPLWNESPSQVNEDQYKEFYRKVFKDYKEPLFWIHLNMDYPFNLKGILYFPKVNSQYENIEGTIKLYNNQVFIADNIKEVIPEYLLLLKGVIDCPDLPLNVSRSALQNDGFVKKISDYITKKVSDRLTGMFKTDRENYEKYWDDISPFIKYGCIKDEKFGDKLKDAIIFKDIDGKYLTADEYIGKKDEPAAEADANAEAPKAEEKPSETENQSEDKPKNKVFYITDVKEQGQYIRMFRNAGKNAVILNYAIDTPFISYMEAKHEDLSFIRIDADITDEFMDTAEKTDEDNKDGDKLISLFRKVLDDAELDVKVEKLKDRSLASMMTMSEEGRRMQEMMKMYAAYGMDLGNNTDAQTLVLNSNNALVAKLKDENAEEPSETGKLIAEQLYDMALLSRGGLNDERMENFIKRSQELLLRL